jgi:ArsR family transcriptional regulator
MDERRRKYYYLANDIEIEVRFQKSFLDEMSREDDPQSHLWASIALLRKMVESRDRLLANLETLEHDIEAKAEEVFERSREAFERKEDAEIVFALAHYDLTIGELAEYTGLDISRLGSRLRVLQKKGIVDEMEKGYTLKGIYASRPVR